MIKKVFINFHPKESTNPLFICRGDSAFCSLECRQQQIIQDERKEKLCSSFASTATAVSEVSTNGEAPTVTAL